jgi:hypothetical protein
MVPVNRDVQSLGCKSILKFWSLVMPFFFSLILLVVLVLITGSKKNLDNEYTIKSG